MAPSLQSLGANCYGLKRSKDAPWHQSFLGVDFCGGLAHRLVYGSFLSVPLPEGYCPRRQVCSLPVESHLGTTLTSVECAGTSYLHEYPERN